MTEYRCPSEDELESKIEDFLLEQAREKDFEKEEVE